jgi:hypothetical protein
MIQRLPLTILFSLFVWACATAFFALLGHQVLVEPSSSSFPVVFLLLEAGTAIALYAVTRLYIRFDAAPYSAVKLGICGSAVGLFLDTFSLWNHSFFFPYLSTGQLLSFAIWMCSAYGLYLTIPVFIQFYSKNKKLK